MKNNTIEDIKEYAKDSQTSEEPTEQNYAEGVKVGWTLPAKWWNWLMNAFTKRFRETKATVDSMYEELSNLMWPLVPGENETNDQCSHRIYGRLSELSEQIGTNTENISKNATAINTEKLARQNAIEQEQISRTQQDNVLDSKISSLYSTVNTNTENISKNATAISALSNTVNTNTESISANTEAISALSNTVNTNTENISKNASAINTEKLARQNAIEQEQASRTSQDEVLNRKINSLYSTVDTNTSNINNKLDKPYFLDNINDNGTYTVNSITLIDTSNLIDIHNPSGVTTFSIHLYGALKYLAIKFIGKTISFDVLTLSSYGELVKFDMKESASSPYIYNYLLLVPFYDE